MMMNAFQESERKIYEEIIEKQSSKINSKSGGAIFSRHAAAVSDQ